MSLVYDLPREEYDALRRTNWSRLRLMGKSPAHYLHGGVKDSAALRLGSLGHLLTVEPQHFEARYLVNDDNRNSNVFKALKATAEAAGKEVVKSTEVEEARAMASAIRNHPIAGAYLEAGRAEVTCLWELAGAGFSFECKARVDFLSEYRGALVEVKTARDVSPRWFSKQAAQLNYHGQLAYYREGFVRATGEKPPRVVVVAVESSAPYVVQVYEVEEDVLSVGWDLCATLLGKLSECTARNEWPGYSEKALRLELPAWAFETEEDVEEEAA